MGLSGSVAADITTTISTLGLIHEPGTTQGTSNIQGYQILQTNIHLLSTQNSTLMLIILYRPHSTCNINDQSVCKLGTKFQVVVMEGFDSMVKLVTSVWKNQVETEAFLNKAFVLATTTGAGNVAIAVSIIRAFE